MLEYYPIIELPTKKIAALIIYNNTDASDDQYTSANDNNYELEIISTPQETNALYELWVNATNNENVITGTFGKK